MRAAATIDPRQRYRTDFDRACEAGFVSPQNLEKNPAWLRYQHAAALCEWSAEEWELFRSLGPYFGPVRIPLAWLDQPAVKTITVGETFINADALRAILKARPQRVGWWPELVRFLGRMQLDVAWVQSEMTLEIRPTRVPSDDHERHLQAHRRFLDAIHRDAEIAAVALVLLGFDPQRMRAQDVADIESRAVQALISIDYPTPLQVAAHVAMQMMLPNAEHLMARAARETPAMRRRLYEGPPVMHPPGFPYLGDPG